MPNELDANAAAIDNGDEEGEEEEEKEEAAQSAVTFAVVNGEIKVDAPLRCTGKEDCTALHSVPLPVLPEDVHFKGFPQLGMIAILLHCKATGTSSTNTKIWPGAVN